MHLPFCLMQFAHIPEEESAIRGDRSTFCSCLALQPHNIVHLSAHMGGRHPMLAGNTSYSIHFSPKANQSKKLTGKINHRGCCIIFSQASGQELQLTVVTGMFFPALESIFACQRGWIIVTHFYRGLQTWRRPFPEIVVVDKAVVTSSQQPQWKEILHVPFWTGLLKLISRHGMPYFQNSAKFRRLGHL